MEDMKKRQKAFFKWYRSLDDRQLAFIQYLIKLDADTDEILDVASVLFAAGWKAARQQDKTVPK